MILYEINNDTLEIIDYDIEDQEPYNFPWMFRSREHAIREAMERAAERMGELSRALVRLQDELEVA